MINNPVVMVNNPAVMVNNPVVMVNNPVAMAKCHFNHLLLHHMQAFPKVSLFLF
jgi:hypothetical protein